MAPSTFSDPLTKVPGGEEKYVVGKVGQREARCRKRQENSTKLGSIQLLGYRERRYPEYITTARRDTLASTRGELDEPSRFSPRVG